MKVLLKLRGDAFNKVREIIERHKVVQYISKAYVYRPETHVLPPAAFYRGPNEFVNVRFVILGI